MQPEILYLLHFDTYQMPGSEDWANNDCGITIYEHGWLSEEQPKFDVWDLYEDENEDADQIWYNDPNGKSPLTFKLFTTDGSNVGLFTYFVKMRVEYINLPQFYFEKQFFVEIRPCEV